MPHGTAQRIFHIFAGREALAEHQISGKQRSASAQARAQPYSRCPARLVNRSGNAHSRQKRQDQRARPYRHLHRQKPTAIADQWIGISDFGQFLI
jgi:hypothetical protein